MASELRIFFANQPGDAAFVERFAEVRVDQAVGIASEATLVLPLALAESGEWSDLTREEVAPRTRVRIEVRVADTEFVPLIDGCIVGQRFSLHAAPNESQLVLTVHDDSALLNRDERVELFEEQSASEIASRLFSEFGLEPQVDDVPAAASQLERVVVQRGTAMQLLRELARQSGVSVYVKPGAAPGSSVGVFRRPPLAASELPELLLLGGARNVERLDVDFDGSRPTFAKASSVNVLDLSTLSSEVTAPAEALLGDEPAHASSDAGTLLLARMRDGDGDLAAAATNAVDASAWAYSADGELDSEVYGAILAPHEVVSVAGLGPLSGNYLVSRVEHVITDDGYRQRFSLRRNARQSAASGASGGGVF